MRSTLFALTIAALAVFGAGAAHAEGATYSQQGPHYGNSHNNYHSNGKDYGPSHNNYHGAAPQSSTTSATAASNYARQSAATSVPY